MSSPSGESAAYARSQFPLSQRLRGNGRQRSRESVLCRRRLLVITILAMLFIGVGMVASVSERHEALLRIHRPLGICILILAVARLSVRLRHQPPVVPHGFR
jgi:hypothetical protein